MLSLVAERFLNFSGGAVGPVYVLVFDAKSRSSFSSVRALTYVGSMKVCNVLIVLTGITSLNTLPFMLSCGTS